MRGGAPVTALQLPLGIDNLFHTSEKILFAIMLHATYNLKRVLVDF